MDTLKKIWEWIKKYPWTIIVAIASTIGAILLWKASSNNIESLDDAIQVKAAIREISRKEGKIKTLEELGDLKKTEIESIKKDIIVSKKRVLEIRNAESLEDKSDDEIAAIFSNSSF
jgi:hypothetical protein